MANDQVMEKNFIVGIDLGTTYSCISVYNMGKINIIKNDEGKETTPSYIAFKKGETLIGSMAKQLASSHPKTTFYDLKRLIGLSYDNVKSLAENLSYEIIDYDGTVKVIFENDGITQEKFPQELSAMLLAKLKGFAEKHLGCTISQAVITVPAYFSPSQRAATQEAAELAGLNVKLILNEPSAAALTYFTEREWSNKSILVYDLGGGTFDVSIVKLDNTVLRVIGVNGHNNLGGQEFTMCLFNHVAEMIEKEYKVELDDREKEMLKVKCENAKIGLSFVMQHEIVFYLKKIDKDAEIVISRKIFEELCNELFQETINLLEKCLEEVKIDKSGIDEIVLVGGSTRIPRIHELLKEFFGKDLNQMVDADVAVSYGAAIAGAIINEEKTYEGVTLLDCTSHPIGIGVTEGKMSIIVNRNTPLPITEWKDYVTSHDNQTLVHIEIYAGDSKEIKNNIKIGDFYVEDLPKEKKGEVGVKIMIDINLSGCLTVTAEWQMKNKEIKKPKIEYKVNKIQKYLKGSENIVVK